MTISPDTAREPLDVLRTEEGFLIARFRTVLFTVWFRTPGKREAEIAHREVLAHKRSTPKGGYMHIVAPVNEERRLTIDDDARQVFTRLTRDCESFSGAAAVIEASGFFGAAARAVVSGVVLIARPAMPTRVFGSVAEAADWLCPKLDAGGAPTGTSSELREGVRLARVRVGRA